LTACSIADYAGHYRSYHEENSYISQTACNLNHLKRSRQGSADATELITLETALNNLPIAPMRNDTGGGKLCKPAAEFPAVWSSAPTPNRGVRPAESPVPVITTL